MKCSFCKKDESEVYKLIAASEKVAICDQCVLQCLDTLIYPDSVIEIDLDEDNDK
jgi:ATP-dependent protease Clp ATPase subunit